MTRRGMGWWACGAVAAAALCFPVLYLAAVAPDTHRPTFRSSMTLHPDEAERALERAVAAIRDGRAAEAAAILLPLSGQVDDDARIWNDLCVAHTLLRDYAAGIGECERALRLAPDFQLARNNLRWAEAERDRPAAGE